MLNLQDPSLLRRQVFIGLGDFPGTSYVCLPGLDT